MGNNIENIPLKVRIEDQLIHGAFAIEGFEQLRNCSKDSLKFIELPDVKTEDWKYTNLRKFLEELSPQNSESEFSLPEYLDENTVYVHNGRLIHTHIAPEYNEWIIVAPLDNFSRVAAHLQIESLSEKTSDYFVLLNNTSFSRGWVILVKSGAPEFLNLRIQYTWSNPTDLALATKNLVYVEASSGIYITEVHQSDDTNSRLFINQVMDCYLEKKSALVFNRMQILKPTVCLLSHTFSSVAEKARFELNNVIGGQGIIRNNFTMNLNEEEAYAGLAGLNLLSGEQHADYRVQMNHFSPNCNSDQLFKSIVNDNSTAVFTGRIYVACGAQKTNAYQSCRSIVLNEKAKTYVRPQLEIYADDVKCSHGATIGQLNEEAVFYMRTRGISKSTAQRLMLSAFATDILSKIHDDEFCKQVEALIKSKFSID